MRYRKPFSSESLVQLLAGITAWAKAHPDITVTDMNVTDSICPWELLPYRIQYTAVVTYTKEEDK